MFCKNCGKEIDDRAEICVHCGIRVAPEMKTTVDNPSNAAGIASCCFPIVGLILYFLWKDEKPNSAKLVCNWMIGGIVAWILFYVVAFVFGAAS